MVTPDLVVLGVRKQEHDALHDWGGFLRSGMSEGGVERWLGWAVPLTLERENVAEIGFMFRLLLLAGV